MCVCVCACEFQRFYKYIVVVIVCLSRDYNKQAQRQTFKRWGYYRIFLKYSITSFLTGTDEVSSAPATPSATAKWNTNQNPIVL